MARKVSWRQRRVSFLVSDAYHAITPASITMPVRVKKRTIDGHPVYEGPIQTVWETKVKPLLTKGDDDMDKLLGIGGPDLVGVLIASDETLSMGMINWMVQSEIEVDEAGAEKIRTVA